MAVLKNTRHERFAQEVAKGKTLGEAYEIAGYAPNSGNPSSLAVKPQVAERINKIKENAVVRAEISIARTREEMAKLGFANIMDYVTVGADGLPFTDFSRVTRDQGAAIQEMTVETRTDYQTNAEGEREAVPVRRVRFKLADKRAALETLGKHLGMFVERHEIGRPGEFDQMSDSELLEAIERERTTIDVTPTKTNGTGH